MPELPEVEVTRRGLAPHLVGKTLTEVVARVGTLRGPLDHLADIEGLRLVNLERRAKMLIWVFEDADGNRSPNLASFAKGHNIDLLANLENKSISPFALRLSLNMLYDDLEEQGIVMSR